MDDLLKALIQGKLRQLSADELLGYSRQYGFDISRQEAEQITHYLKTTNNDPFSRQDRDAMFHDLKNITDKHTAQRAEQLFSQIIKTYGVNHMFK